MKIRRFPALVLGVVFLALFVPAVMAQAAYKLFSATPDTNSTDGPNTNRGSALIDVTCPALTESEGSGPSAVLSSTQDGLGKVLQDNWINLTDTLSDSSSSVNVCTGGYSDPNNPSNHQGTDCFAPAYTGVGGNTGTFGTFPDPQTYGVLPLNVTLSSGLNHLQFDLINDGGPYGNSDIYLVTNCGKTQTQTLTFNPGTNVQQQATFNCGDFSSTTGCSSPDAYSGKWTYDTVKTTFHLQIIATEFAGDGMCPIPTGNANDSVPADFDCTLANFFGSTLPSYAMYPYINGQTSVQTPFCLGYGSNNNCVDIEAKLVESDMGQSSGFVHVYIAWNKDTAALFSRAPAGYVNNPQLYDAPHNDQDTADYPAAPNGYPYPGTNTDLQKVFNVTGYYNVKGIAGLDGGVGTGPPSGVKKPNHYVVAFPFTPPDVGELLFSGLPHPDGTTTCYPTGWPMLVSFEIEKGEQQDPNVQTPSHPLRVTVQQDGVNQNIGNPTVNHLFGTIYYVFLSNANLPVNSATNLIPYTLQVSTDLIPAPLTQNFVVQKSCF